MIDLHTHTTASDGTFSPAELVQAAKAAGLDVLAISDHDTFAGHDEAGPLARAEGLELICAIELGTKQFQNGKPQGRSIHLLGYFLHADPGPQFRGWLAELQAARRDRNRRLATRLQSMGFDIRIEEVEALGRNMAGRPHFAHLMVQKGYVRNLREAFDEYLDESAKGYVDRDEPSIEKGIREVLDAGGFPSLAHPIRVGKFGADEEALIADLREKGLLGLEVYHSDHSPADMERYAKLAERYGLTPSGGSDFHGAMKPEIKLGRGKGNLSIPVSVLERMRAIPIG